MDPILDLPIRLPRRGSRALLRSLHSQLKEAILDGRLRPGLRLPATRDFAASFGVSRNTAVATYDLLLSEGYLTARRGAGTYIATSLPRPMRAAVRRHDNAVASFWRKPPLLLPPTSLRAYKFDFRTGLSDKTEFPFHVWRRLSARALRGLSKTSAAYLAAEGRAELRAAIAGHISFARAVACEADDVVVTNGAQQGFDLLARVLVTPGQTVVAVEDPGYPQLRSAFAASGARIAPIPVDDEGLVVERLPRATRIICVTPSHQFPLGVTMSLRRRMALLEFARGRDAVIIEDDYDGEFRFVGPPLDALQTLGRDGCVIYVGTFSKSLFPALRLGYVVAPPWLRPALIAAKQMSDWHCAVLAQDTLATFIAEGHLARHVRKMRRIYGERRAVLLGALARHAGGRLQVIPGDTGLHLAVRLDGRTDAPRVAARLDEAGIGVAALTRFGPGAPNGLAFGYGMIARERIDAGVRALAAILR